MLARPMQTSTAPRKPVHILDYVDECLVTCPKCEGVAVVKHRNNSQQFVCKSCGKTGHTAGSSRQVGVVDPHFGLPLWLQVPCGGHTLWAFNRYHLAFLRDYIVATDRRRPQLEAGGSRNALLSSRLPRWMVLARNRSTVLRGLDRLDEKLLRAG